jgi:hypothetical protein
VTEPTDEQIEARDKHILFMVEYVLKPIFEGDEYDDANKNALLAALYACLELRKSPMPKWVAEASRQRLDDFFQSRVRTLDEAFTVTEKKHKNLSAERKKKEIMPRIVEFVRELQADADGCSLEEAFEVAAKKWNVSTSAARDTYYYPQLKLEQRLAVAFEEMEPTLEYLKPILNEMLWPKNNKDAET